MIISFNSIDDLKHIGYIIKKLPLRDKAFTFLKSLSFREIGRRRI